MKVSRRTLFGVASVIFAAAIWLHSPSTRGDFLDVDDKEYLQEAMRWHGLTWGAVEWAFTTTVPYYHPLPRLFHVLDYQLWGKNPAGHHVSSVVLHALNAALMFGFLWTLLGAVSLAQGERLVMAFGIALVFAIHPFQVESVAWIAGRTQLLCATFGIRCLWLYLTGAPRWKVWGLFVLAWLCKPTAISLPFVMLALDYFPLRRHVQLGWRRLLVEKSPMLALSIVAGALTTITEADVAPWKIATLSDRVLMTFQSLVFYPWRLACPWHISPFYQLQLRPTVGEWKVIVSVLSVGIITAVALAGRRRLPALTSAWAAYAAFVLPVSGLTQGLGAVAPRHAYVAMVPLLLLAGGGADWLWQRSTLAVRVGLTGLLVCELCVFVVCARDLIPEWYDEESMRRAVLRWFPGSEFDNRMLALTLLDQGRASEALKYATRAVEIAPEQCYAHTALGSVLYRLGRLPEARAEYEQAFRANKNPLLAHYNFGLALLELHAPDEAAKELEQAIKIKPDNPMAHYNLGKALNQVGKVQDAMQEYLAALRIAPDYAEAHNSLGVILAQLGRLPEAAEQWEQALQAEPDFAQAHNNLGHALMYAGRMPEAIDHLERAVQIDPDYAGAHVNLGLALMRSGRLPEAMEQWEQALRLNPDIAEAHFNLAVALEKTGRTREAIDHYQQVLRLRPDHAAAKGALARLGAIP